MIDPHQFGREWGLPARHPIFGYIIKVYEIGMSVGVDVCIRNIPSVVPLEPVFGKPDQIGEVRKTISGQVTGIDTWPRKGFGASLEMNFMAIFTVQMFAVEPAVLGLMLPGG